MSVVLSDPEFEERSKAIFDSRIKANVKIAKNELIPGILVIPESKEDLDHLEECENQILSGYEKDLKIAREFQKFRRECYDNHVVLVYSKDAEEVPKYYGVKSHSLGKTIYNWPYAGEMFGRPLGLEQARAIFDDLVKAGVVYNAIEIVSV